MRYFPISTRPQKRAAKLFDGIMTAIESIDRAASQVDGEPRGQITHETFVLREFAETLREIVLDYYARPIKRES